MSISKITKEANFLTRDRGVVILGVLDAGMVLKADRKCCRDGTDPLTLS
jgi:hypothetical protein